MRNAFIDELVQLARRHPHIALVVGDLGFSVVEPFAEEFPDRFLNAGVAEQNMTGLAAGMASEGYHVFTYSIANFPTFRCAEQIRNDVDYHNLPVTVVSIGGGVGYGALGYSHHAVQDYALMRSFPNMMIAAPGDPFEVRSCLRYLVEKGRPSYLRLGKAGERIVHCEEPNLQDEGWLELRKPAASNILLTTGSGLQSAISWLDDGYFPDHGLYSAPLWSMAGKVEQIDRLGRFSEVIVIEDHLLDGGFASYLSEATLEVDHLGTIIKSKALSSKVCGTVGSQKTLHSCGQLTP